MSQIAFDLTKTLAARPESSAALPSSDGPAFADRLQEASTDRSPVSDEPTPPASTEGENASEDVLPEEATVEDGVQEAEDAVVESEDASEADAEEAAVVAAVVNESAKEEAIDLSDELASDEVVVEVTNSKDESGSGEGDPAKEALANTLEGQASDDAGGQVASQQTNEVDATLEHDESEATEDAKATDKQADSDLTETIETAAEDAGEEIAPNQESDDVPVTSSSSNAPAEESLVPTAETDLPATPQNGGEQSAGDKDSDTRRRQEKTDAAPISTAAEAAPESSREETTPRAETPQPTTAEANSPTDSRSDNTNPALSRIAAGRVEPQGASANEESGPRVDATRFVNRVTGAFRAAQERGGEVRLRLSPPELGVLQIKLTVAEGVLNASLETENTAARNAILDNLPALRERLAEQEIRVDKFDVDVRQEGGNDAQDWAPGERRDGESGNQRQTTGEDAAARDTADVAPQPTAAVVDGRINLVA